MIHPRAEIVDLDPRLWGDLAVAVQQSRRRREWAYVLHCDGVVVSTLPGELRAVRPGDAVEDPRALAQQLRAETGCARAVVLDERGLDDLVVRATACAGPERTLAELRGDVADLYWSSPAVATDPPEPPDDPQLRIRAALQRSAPPRATALLRILRGTGFGAAVSLDLEDGLITRCVCVGEEEAERRSASADLWADLSWDALMAAVASADPWPSFAAVLEAAERQRGLDAVRSALRAQAATV
jgi:hypothetical protein